MSDGARQALADLKKHIKEVYLLRSIGGILGWDERVYMPRQGGAHRANQLAYLSGKAHSLVTDPKVGEWLVKIESSGILS
ncbi:MAG: carboxypeptidase M32, partial [bacterium]